MGVLSRCETFEKWLENLLIHFCHRENTWISWCIGIGIYFFLSVRKPLNMLRCGSRIQWEGNRNMALAFSKTTSIIKGHIGAKSGDISFFDNFPQ